MDEQSCDCKWRKERPYWSAHSILLSILFLTIEFRGSKITILDLIWIERPIFIISSSEFIEHNVWEQLSHLEIAIKLNSLRYEVEVRDTKKQSETLQKKWEIYFSKVYRHECHDLALKCHHDNDEKTQWEMFFLFKYLFTETRSVKNPIYEIGIFAYTQSQAVLPSPIHAA